MLGLRHDECFEERACLFGLAGLQVAKREVLREGRFARVFLDELLVDLDGARVETQTKVHDRQEVLALGVAWLELQRLLELVLRFVDAVVLEQLAAAVEVKEKVFRRLHFRRPMP